MAQRDISFTSESGNVSAITFDDETNELTIRFSHGGTYRYSGVDPSVANGFATAPSAGQYLNSFIKGVYEFEKV